MSDATARSRGSAVITVHKYGPAAYDEPAEGPVLTRIHVQESFSDDMRRRINPPTGSRQSRNSL